MYKRLIDLLRFKPKSKSINLLYISYLQEHVYKKHKYVSCKHVLVNTFY